MSERYIVSYLPRYVLACRSHSYVSRYMYIQNYPACYESFIILFGCALQENRNVLEPLKKDWADQPAQRKLYIVRDTPAHRAWRPQLSDWSLWCVHALAVVSIERIDRSEQFSHCLVQLNCRYISNIKKFNMNCYIVIILLFAPK